MSESLRETLHAFVVIFIASAIPALIAYFLCDILPKYKITFKIEKGKRKQNEILYCNF